MRLRDFNKIILEAGEEGIGLVADKYLIQGIPFVFRDREPDFYDFKKHIAEHFSVGTHEIFIVGSGKMGFSYISQRDSFTAESDIDIAIISNRLFDEYSTIIREYVYDKKAHLITHSKEEERDYRFVLQNMALGWIRPDIFPDIFTRILPDPQWDEFFRSISSGRSEVGDYEVKGGVFRSYDDLHRYHAWGLSSILKKLEVKTI